MTRDELLDWGQATGRIPPIQSVRDNWGDAYDRDPAGTIRQLQSTPGMTALSPEDALAVVVLGYFETPY